MARTRSSVTKLALTAALALGGGLAIPATTAQVAQAVGSTTQIQMDLIGLGHLPKGSADGSYGPATTAAAKAFQNNRCLDTDGQVGNITWGELTGRVKAIQAKAGTTADGIYGSGTTAAVARWQTANGLSGTGIADATTMSKMGIQRVYPCGGPIVGDVKADSTNVPCFAGTRDLGIRTDAYKSGIKYSIRICAIPAINSTASESTVGNAYYVSGANGDVIVNSRVSGAFQGVALRATRSGVSISAASGWRSMAHQTYLYNTLGSVQAARPGYSNHQSGNAVDFSTGGSVKSGATCSTRSTSTSLLYGFLRRNAPKHGIGQYAGEAWHWEPLAVGSCS